MKIEVNLQKKYILGILISFVLVTAISLTYAYNTNWASAPGNPAIMGHSPDEIVGNLLCGTGQALTITSTGWSCVSTGGSSVTNNYALPAGYAEVYVNAGQDTSTLTLANTTSAPQDTCGNNGPFTTVAYTGNGTGYYTSSSIYNPFGQYQEINRTQGAGQYICGVTENKTCVNVYLDHILGSQTYYDVSTVQCKQAKALVRYLNPPIPGKVVNLSLLTYGGGACALINDSTVKCAGYNQYGELGNGNNYNSYVFTSVLNLNNVVQVVSDDVYACALKNDGTVWCWGYGGDGELGDGKNYGIQGYSNTPVNVLQTTTGSTLNNVKKIVTTVTFTQTHSRSVCALKNDGTVWCWGDNYYGELGNGGSGNSNTAVQVSNINNAVDIEGGYYNICAVVSGGTVRCWGLNQYGELGMGNNNVYSTTPVNVVQSGGGNLNNVASIATTSGAQYKCALKNDGTVWCWGWNGYGELGIGSQTNSNVAAQVQNIGGTFPKATMVKVSSITNNPGIACALLADGTMWCWGYAGNGQIGTGTIPAAQVYTVPTKVQNLNNVLDFAMEEWGNGGTACALKNDGTVWCWGYNGIGQIGDGTQGNIRNAPVQIPGLTNIQQVFANTNQNGAIGSNYALKNDGTLWVWGYDGNGGLGNGNNVNQVSPVQATFI